MCSLLHQLTVAVTYRQENLQFKVRGQRSFPTVHQCEPREREAPFAHVRRRHQKSWMPVGRRFCRVTGAQPIRCTFNYRWYSLPVLPVPMRSQQYSRNLLILQYTHQSLAFPEFSKFPLQSAGHAQFLCKRPNGHEKQESLPIQHYNTRVQFKSYCPPSATLLSIIRYLQLFNHKVHLLLYEKLQKQGTN